MDSVREYVHAPPENIPVDMNDLLDRCLGRVDLAQRILERFQCALEQDVRRLEAAVLATNTDEIAHLAHRIKGASLAVSAYELKDCAQCIETSATARRLEEIPVQLARLQQESSRFEDLRINIVAENRSC